MAQIVEQAISGDNAAFEALFNAHWNMAYYYCLKYFNHSAEAEDIAQDAFFTLFRNIGKLNNPQSFQAFFSKILVNTCHNRSKSNKYKNDNAMFSIDDFSETLQEKREEFLPEEIMSEKELKDEILHLIAELPKKQREVMLLHYLQELSQSEIAKILDVTPSVIGNRLFLAKDSLRQKLEKRDKESEISAFMPFPPIAQILLEEMETVATPEVRARAWEGLQSQITAYNAEARPANCSSSSSAINIGIIVLACAALMCFVAFGVNYFNAAQPAAQPAEHCEMQQPEGYDVLEALQTVATADDFNEFAAEHNFYIIQLVTRNTPAEEIQYRLYQRNCFDTTIFIGVRESSAEFRMVYETVPLGTLQQQDLIVWINEN